MIKHVYLFKLRDRSAAGAVAERIRTLKDRIASIHALEVGVDFRGTGNSYDLIETCAFLTREDFDAFSADAYHEEIRQYLATVVEASWKVDYEL